jgi:hypothetical protein
MAWILTPFSNLFYLIFKSPFKTLPCFWWRRGRVELPVQRKLSRIYYRFIQLFNLTRLTSTDRVKPGQPIFLSPPLSASGRRHLNFSAPNPNPLRWGQVGWQPVFRLQPLLVRHLCFRHQFIEVVAPQPAIQQPTSPVEPARPHLSRTALATSTIILTLQRLLVSLASSLSVSRRLMDSRLS